MQDIWKLFHSPHHLVVFEVAARRGSFTAAARELNVSQPAVSLAVKQLETALGVPLFIRRHRSVELTQAGEDLAQEVRGGLSRIIEAGHDQRRKNRRNHTTLSMSTAFANYWMVPRLAEFRDMYPDVDLRLQTTDKDLDLAVEGLDLGVRRGNGDWSDLDGELIAPEILVPIASPLLSRQMRTIRTLADLSQTKLIHLDEPYRPRPTWQDWFRALGQEYSDRSDGLRLNDYGLVIQATMAGEGIALGWTVIIRRLIEQQLLIPVGDWRWETGAGLYLVWPKERPLSAGASRVRDWIVSKAEASE